MAPSAVDKTREDLSVPKTSFSPTMNMKMADKKRKIICFSDFDGLVVLLYSCLRLRSISLFSLRHSGR